MRSGSSPHSTFAMEQVADELARAAGIDPVALRLKNYADKDPDNGHPFSSKSLRECYARAAERFGWSKRKPEPRSSATPASLPAITIAPRSRRAIY